MALDTSQYLDEFYSNIRARPIAWDAYVRSNLVTDSDVKKIKAVDKLPGAQRAALVAADARGYAELVLGDSGVLRKAESRDRLDIVQYLLLWTQDLLDVAPTFAESLLQLPKPFDLLLSLLATTDAPVPLLARGVLTQLLAAALAAKPSGEAELALGKFYHHLANATRAPELHEQDLAVQSYVRLLRTRFAKDVFWGMREQTMLPLVRVLEASAHGEAGGVERGVLAGSGVSQGGVPLQLLYHVLLVVWELSFEEDVAEEINGLYDVIPIITAILRCSIKEKITRVALAVLHNLCAKAAGENLPALLVTGILPHLQTLSNRFTADSDPELVGDLAAVIALLEDFQSTQTTLSSYRLEVMAGHLRWSPPHRNDTFWKKHAREILDDKELVQKLVAVLLNSQDKTVLAVAANDIGTLVREVPYARKRWEDLGAKARVMELMGDSDAEVRYEALRAVQAFLQSAFAA